MQICFFFINNECFRKPAEEKATELADRERFRKSRALQSGYDAQKLRILGRKIKEENKERKITEEAEKIAQEVEAKKIAQEVEAKKIAQEVEAKKIAQEVEAKKIAQEVDAKKIAQEVDAEKIAAQKEEAKKRLAGEGVETPRTKLKQLDMQQR